MSFSWMLIVLSSQCLIHSMPLINYEISLEGSGEEDTEAFIYILGKQDSARIKQ